MGEGRGQERMGKGRGQERVREGRGQERMGEGEGLGWGDLDEGKDRGNLWHWTMDTQEICSYK